MIRLNESVPHKISIAVSGGPDSMAALDFLSKSRNVMVLHYNHGTPHAHEAEQLVTDFCKERGLPLLTSRLLTTPPPGDSKEDFWRKQRYEFFEQVSWTPEYSTRPVITCHHLDDVAETWLFTSLHGEGRLIPSRRGRYLRPFLMTRKAIFEDWCDRHNIPHVIDPSNEDTRFMRNYIRHEVLPKALRVNPGLHKVLRKKIEKNPVILDGLE
jgi:tRNA(Ile)-lysidine synthetase-like protein